MPRLPAVAALALCLLSCLSACGAVGDAGTLAVEAEAPFLDAAAPADAGRQGEAYDGGAPVDARIGGDGGTASRLYFAVVGDTRPAAKDDVEGYPTGVASAIYSRIAAIDPRPAFVVSTGDYQFASTTGTSASAQVGLYARARAVYPGPLFPAMGNHECTGATASNCGSAARSGVTAPMRAFGDLLLAPIGKTLPYYEVDVDAPDRSWTSKLLVVAANAWSPEQAAWLESAMQRATTYTFVVRHEASNVTAAPGVGPSEATLGAHPYTLVIAGHKHSYEHVRAREIIVGNGGAPLTGSKDYGFAVVSQQPGGSLAVDVIDYATGLADPEFHFVVGP